MSKTAVNSVTNANVYLNGTNTLGRAEEVKLPSVKNKTSDHKALGMFSEIKLPTGGLEPMECEYNWVSVYPEVSREISDPRKSVTMQVRATIEAYTSRGFTAEMPLVATITGPFTETGLGGFKQNESVKTTSKQAVWYYKLEIDGETVYEIDVFANIRKVAGADVLARFRQIVGG